MTSTKTKDCADFGSDFDSYLKHYVSSHDELYKSVQSEIADWTQETQNEIELESIKHFAAEKKFLDKISEMKAKDFFANIDELESQYNDIESVIERFDMQKYFKSYKVNEFIGYSK